MAPSRHKKSKSRASKPYALPRDDVTPTNDKKRTNQHKPCPPNVRPILEFYWDLGMNDRDIADSIMDHYDKEQYSISRYTVKRRRDEWNLLSTRKQKHTPESIAAHVNAIKERFPDRGAENIRKALRMENKIRAPREVIAEYLRMVEPEAVAARRHKRFKKRAFKAIGNNEMWCFDQHDKWKRFGIFLHVGLDPFPGVIHHCRVWWNVRNPKLIASFYLDTARRLGGIPLTTQSDPGTENVRIAYGHTALRHRLDPSLADSIQHRWFRKHGNIKPEVHWSIFRKDFAPGMEALLSQGVENGWYDVGDPLEVLVFRYVFIPFIQAEVNAWVHQRNWTKPRADRRKILPNGIPMIILNKPQRYNAADYLIPVTPELFDEIEEKYAPRDDPIFKLVPEEFAARAAEIWVAMGAPIPCRENAWTIYLHIREELGRAPLDPVFQEILEETAAQTESAVEPVVDNIPQDLLDGQNVYGAVEEESEDEAPIVIQASDLLEDGTADAFIITPSLLSEVGTQLSDEDEEQVPVVAASDTEYEFMDGEGEDGIGADFF